MIMAIIPIQPLSQLKIKSQMSVELAEFKNSRQETLRGIKHAPSKKAEHVVIFIHGFERNSTAEKKFKSLADLLEQRNTASFRFDAAGCGISDGEFQNVTVRSRVDDFRQALAKISSYPRVSIVAHSLGACILDSYLSEHQPIEFQSVVLLAPALNQKELLRYWFVQSEAQKKDPQAKINWSNYREKLNEQSFQEDCKRSDKMTKMNFLGSEYFLENKEAVYGKELQKLENALHVHGDEDNKVPMESNPLNFPNMLQVKKGDHDLERPDMLKQWLDATVDFLT